MTEININELLENLYKESIAEAANRDKPSVELDRDIAKSLDAILIRPENHKAMIAVVLTSMVYKKLYPEQDVRNHQKEIPGGYSGRTFDEKFITPFLRDHGFPAMAESGWLTRSFEHKVPYDFNYTGSIKPASLKIKFLNILNYIQAASPEEEFNMLRYFIQGLIIDRESSNILLAKPQNLSIINIIELLDNHFHSKYHTSGASRLPVLAIFAIYSCLKNEGQKRYEDKVLLPLENHTSADSQSGRIGDIQLNNLDGSAFEAVEVKFDIPISYDIAEIAKDKLFVSTAERYYILSTKDVKDSDKSKIAQLINSTKNSHGCQIIINGILPTIKYYLRLLEDPNAFVLEYVKLMEEDKTIKFEHKEKWNALVGKL